MQRPNRLELGQQILLLAAVIVREDNLLGRAVLIVGQVEEVSVVIEKVLLRRLTHFPVLADDDETIRVPAGLWAIRHLAHPLINQSNVLEAAVFDHLLFDPLAPRPWLGSDLIFRRSF